MLRAWLAGRLGRAGQDGDIWSGPFARRPTERAEPKPTAGALRSHRHAQPVGSAPCRASTEL